MTNLIYILIFPILLFEVCGGFLLEWLVVGKPFIISSVLFNIADNLRSLNKIAKQDKEIMTDPIPKNKAKVEKAATKEKRASITDETLD